MAKKETNAKAKKRKVSARERGGTQKPANLDLGPVERSPIDTLHEYVGLINRIWEEIDNIQNATAEARKFRCSAVELDNRGNALRKVLVSRAKPKAEIKRQVELLRKVDDVEHWMPAGPCYGKWVRSVIDRSRPMIREGRALIIATAKKIGAAEETVGELNDVEQRISGLYECLDSDEFLGRGGRGVDRDEDVVSKIREAIEGKNKQLAKAVDRMQDRLEPTFMASIEADHGASASKVGVRGVGSVGQGEDVVQQPVVKARAWHESGEFMTGRFFGKALTQKLRQAVRPNRKTMKVERRVHGGLVYYRVADVARWWPLLMPRV